MASSDPAANDDTTFYRYGYDNQRYLKFTTHHTTSGGGGGGCGTHCPVDDTGGGQAYLPGQGAFVNIASLPTDTVISDERYPGQYHHVDIGKVVQDFVFLNGQKLATLNNGSALFFVMGDHLGSSDLVTDATGTATEYRDYTPFGTSALTQVLSDSKNDYLFTGKEVDGESALQYFGARYLSNSLARFASVDSLLLDNTKLSKKLIDPQALNTYAYSRNNPVVLVDSDGNDFGASLLLIGAISLGSVFFGNIQAAQAPTSQSAIQPTPPPTKNIAELYVPGYDSTPQMARMTLGVGVMLIAPEVRGREIAEGAAASLARISRLAKTDAGSVIADDALVVRGGGLANQAPGKFRIGPSRTPGVEGFSVQCSNNCTSIDQLGEIGKYLPNMELTVVRAKIIRQAGGDVVSTIGRGEHATVTGLDGYQASSLFKDVYKNPNPFIRK